MRRDHVLRLLPMTVLFLAVAVLSGCRESPEARRQRTTAIVTARTVGLAYLEENKLAEAEAEFLKLIDLAPDEPLGYADLGLVYLRLGRFDDAERRVRQALDRASGNPDIRLILAKVYELTGRESEAITVLRTTIEGSPDHVKTRYALAELLVASEDPANFAEASDHLAAVVRAIPANVAARLELMETQIVAERPESAAVQLEELRRLIPAIPPEAVPFLDRALALLREGQASDALRPAATFHNFLKATSLYQADVIDLRGPGGALIGFPVITFHQDLSLETQDEATVLAGIRFTDISEDVGLGQDLRADGDSARATIRMAVADYDGDNDHDIFVVGERDTPGQTVRHLLQDDAGRFRDVAVEAGIESSGTNALFTDYDNDGSLDLYIVKPGANVLYQNRADGSFRDVTAAAGVGDGGRGRVTVFLDIDHDGDLDGFVGNDGPNRLFRNNADGTFTEQASTMGLAGSGARTVDAAFGDFDDDGDIDLFTVNETASNALYSNLRQSRFDNTTAAAGLASDGRSSAVAVADYDNDGFLDLLVTSFDAGRHQFFRNRSDGTFERDTRPAAVYRRVAGTPVYDAEFFDFDNDGFLDIVMAAGEDGLLLFRNDGPGTFTDLTELLPASAVPAGAAAVAVADYGEDGDLDIFVATFDGGIRLLRNDGGNVNHFLTMKLVGLTTGSGKNNYFGIGAKLEVRAGDLYQLRVVTQPTTHIGLGSRLKADVVRIVWTNGVPQNIFFPGGDQDLLEQQILKGSCAFVYTWDGEEYSFVKDVMWKSAIGMPTGIMGGLRSYAPPDASKEYLKIPGDRLKPRDGKYTLQLTEELWEVAYVDEVKLLTVDHPDSVEVYVDEKFVPPGPPKLRIYQVATKQYPVAAWDDHQTDLLTRIRAKDDVYIDNLTPGKYQGLTEEHDLILDLGDIAPGDSLHLFLQGWVFPTDASINVAMAQSDVHRTIFPYVQVPDATGEWRTVVANMSFPSGKDKTVVVDLTGTFSAKDYRVRIRTNMEIYWDHVFFTQPRGSVPTNVTTLAPSLADLHYRGFSRLYRKGGRHGPHWFDYASVTTESPWLDMVGSYTRYGDVLPLLTNSDDMYVIMPAGDEVTIEFDVDGAPPVPRGWTRDFLLYTDGWIKDGDLNTATGQTVEPLPFHDMSRYPYGREESYPDDPTRQAFLEQYNRRTIGRTSN